MQVTITFTRHDIIEAIEKEIADRVPNLERVTREYAGQVPESLSIEIVLKRPQTAKEE